MAKLTTRVVRDYVEKRGDRKNKHLTKLYLSLLSESKNPFEMRDEGILSHPDGDKRKRYLKAVEEYEDKRKEFELSKKRYDKLSHRIKYKAKTKRPEDQEIIDQYRKKKRDLKNARIYKRECAVSHTHYSNLLKEFSDEKQTPFFDEYEGGYKANPEILYSFLREYTLTKSDYENAREELEELIHSGWFKKEVTGTFALPGSWDFIHAIYYLILRSRPLLKAKKLFTLERVGKYFFNDIIMMKQMWRGGWFLDQNFDSKSFRGKVGDMIIQDILSLFFFPDNKSRLHYDNLKTAKDRKSMILEKLKSISDPEKEAERLYEILKYIRGIDNHISKKYKYALTGGMAGSVMLEICDEYYQDLDKNLENVRSFLRELINLCERNGERIHPKLKKRFLNNLY